MLALRATRSTTTPKATTTLRLLEGGAKDDDATETLDRNGGADCSGPQPIGTLAIQRLALVELRRKYELALTEARQETVNLREQVRFLRRIAVLLGVLCAIGHVTMLAKLLL